MAGITTSTVDDLCNIAIAESRLWLPQRANLREVITNYNIAANPFRIPIFTSAPTVVSVTEGTDVTTTSDLSTDGVNITAATKMVRTYISDLVDAVSVEQLGVKFGNWAAQQLAAKINQDIYALFDGFSSVCGDTTSLMSPTLIREARAILEKNGANEPFYLAITPHMHEDLLASLDQTSVGTYRVSNVLVDKAQVTGKIEEIFGVKVLIVNNLAAGTSAGQKDSATLKAGMFSAEALAINTVWDVRVRALPDLSMVGNEIVADIAYGVAELHDEAGVEIVCVNNND